MDSKSDKIFVQIPSYRDTQLIPTIESLFSNAFNCDRLVVWICWQHSLGEMLPTYITNLPNVNIIDFYYKRSKGAGWAKSILQTKWDGEPFSLLVDSHTRFNKHWDKTLTELIRLLKNDGVCKPIITTLPPPFYDPINYPKNRLNYPLKIYPRAYERGLLTRFYGQPIPLFKWLNGPLPAQFIAMGFLFTEGQFNSEIPVDPQVYFFGDDITTGLRAYTHGYKFFHPHRVIAWHLYDRSTRVPHWDDDSRWVKLDNYSYERVRKLLSGVSIAGFSLGNERSVIDYEDYIGCKLISK